MADGSRGGLFDVGCFSNLLDVSSRARHMWPFEGQLGHSERGGERLGAQRTSHKGQRVLLVRIRIHMMTISPKLTRTLSHRL